MNKTALLITTLIIVFSGNCFGRDITFIATSDCHYDYPENQDRNERNRATLRHINEITNITFPKVIGGDKIKKPLGVVVIGDLIDDGDRCTNGISITEIQWKYYEADFGLNGSDGLLNYPVFDTFGNHDGPPEGAEKCGFSTQAKLKQRNILRLEKKMISNLSTNNLQYSWDWDDVHFVMVGIYPANVQNPLIKKYSPVWHNPQGALDFLKSDLEQKVGKSKRPVVIMAHCGFDTPWWHTNDWVAFYDAVKPYNVILYLYGHTGTGLKEWAPPGETKKIQCINTGQTENGFFVVNITNKKITAAYRIKHWIIDSDSEQPVDQDMTNSKKIKRTWDGTYEWKFPLKKTIK
ncbi:MAG TPA: metallophosphoesterase [Verrucomicrobiota bacterium]|nr:metallophosphoesterase [Verrucomicrobiota bacterium]